MDLINFLLPKIEHFRMLGYWTLLLVSLLESLAFVGLIIPGSTFVVLMGALSARGYWDLGDLIWFAAVGAILGDGISYVLGSKGKILFSESNRIFRSSYLERGEAFFRDHGGKSVFLGRFLGPVRAVIPFVAGISRMDPRSFYLWNILSAILWAGSHLLIGYLFGNAWNMVEQWGGRVGFLLAVIVLFMICSYLLERFILTTGRQLTAWVGNGLASVAKRIADIPRVRSAAERHPRFLHLLKSRLNTQRFSGLPLTLLGMVFLYILLVFLGVVEDIVNQESIVAADTRFAGLLFGYRSAELVKAFLWITLLGRANIVLCLALVATVLLWLWNRRTCILPLWISLGGSYLLTFLGKVIVHRQRPPEVGYYTEAFYSFPSGHATIAAAFYGFVAYCLARRPGTWRARLNLSFAALMLIVAVGFSRLYLGVHFLSDVLGGYLLGLLWLIIAVCLSELLAERETGQPGPRLPAPALRGATALLLLLAAAWYVHAGLRYHPVRHAAKAEAAPVVVEHVIRGFDDLRLPRYTESITATAGKPVNVIMVAESDASFSAAMQKAGWQSPDPVGFDSMTEFASDLLRGRNYPAAPIALLFWNGRANELGFVASSPDDLPGMRREARFWNTRLATPDNGKIYAGLVSRTTGYRWWAVPKTSPHMDTERERLLTTLETVGLVKSSSLETFVRPVSRGASGETAYVTDGRIRIIRLR